MHMFMTVPLNRVHSSDDLLSSEEPYHMHMGQVSHISERRGPPDSLRDSVGFVTGG